MNTLAARSSGVLLHITALPGGHGIGDLGSSARDFVDWLERAGQSWWQVLPCTPTDFGDSPYQSPSAYAGNPLLISLQELVEWDLLTAAEISAVFHWVDSAAQDRVDFDRVREGKEQLLSLACERFATRAPDAVQQQFATFCAADEQHWLHDYARFCVLKSTHNEAGWQSWSVDYAQRNPHALAQFDEDAAQALQVVKYQQFMFTSQWQALRAYAAQRGVGFIGDCPIYVATDSADVWSHPELFDLLDDGQPRVVAGVPPDYFSATGQLWGNPLYEWDRMRADNFAWWRSRMRHCAGLFDVTRIDHFRGFDAYWEVPGGAPDASTGCWRTGPGKELLGALAQESVQLIAEDLGDLTESVHELRRSFGLPGMRVLQFGFDGGSDNPHAVERIGDDVVCYVGTHDNNTTLGWYNELDGSVRVKVRSELGLHDTLPETFDSNHPGCVQLLERVTTLALDSRAPLCVLTMQDLLGLDESARFNTPGTVGNNWRWRMSNTALAGRAGESLAQQLHLRTNLSQRLGNQIQDLHGTAVQATQ